MRRTHRASAQNLLVVRAVGIRFGVGLDRQCRVEDYKVKEKHLYYLLVFISIAEVRQAVTYRVLNPGLCVH